jgi:hypothetical protein
VDVAPGPTLVYYESPHSVPEANCTLYMRNPYEERVMARIPSAPAVDLSYRVSLTGWSGRALWAVDLDEPGTYEFRCTNANFPSDEAVPVEDRIVFFKHPESLAVARGRQKLFKIAGGVVTVALAIVLYVMHGLSLRRDAATIVAEAATGEPVREEAEA